MQWRNFCFCYLHDALLWINCLPIYVFYKKKLHFGRPKPYSIWSGIVCAFVKWSLCRSLRDPSNGYPKFQYCFWINCIVGIQFKFIFYSIFYRAIVNKSKFSFQLLINSLSGGYYCCVGTKIVHFTDFFLNFTKPVLLVIIDVRNVILKINISVCFLKPGFGVQIRANSSIKSGSRWNLTDAHLDIKSIKI